MSGGRGGLPCTSEKARKREVSFLDGNLFLEAILGRESDNWATRCPALCGHPRNFCMSRMSNVSTVRLLLLKQNVGLKSAYINQGTSLPISTGKTTQAHLQTDVMKHHEPVVH